MKSSDSINWPPYYIPSKCPVHVRNQLAMNASPEVVWAWLIRAQLWPAWYCNSANVKFLTTPPPDLCAGAKFEWKTFGITLVSEMMEFIPCERIAWNAIATGVECYHAWLITPTVGGCEVLTEESQHGLLARLSNFVLPDRMHHYHAIWLESLAKQAALGMPANGKP